MWIWKFRYAFIWTEQDAGGVNEIDVAGAGGKSDSRIRESAAQCMIFEIWKCK